MNLHPYNQDDDAHWGKFVKPHALSPGNHFIAHHWGRQGMQQGMKEKLDNLRRAARERGCLFMSATTLREPVERDISDTVFRRVMGVKGEENYLGNEQLRFLLLNAKHTSNNIPASMDVKTWPNALQSAKKMLREHFDVVTTIDDLEPLKQLIDKFYGIVEPSPPLEHIHKIDYEKYGIRGQELQRLTQKFRNADKLDLELYRIAQERSKRDTRRPVSHFGVQESQLSSSLKADNGVITRVGGKVGEAKFGTPRKMGEAALTGGVKVPRVMPSKPTRKVARVTPTEVAV